MAQRTTGVPRGKKSTNYHGEGPSLLLIAGGALLSTLSIGLGYKLKQVMDIKHQDAASNGSKGKGKSLDRRKPSGCPLHSNVYAFRQDDEGCFNCMSGAEGIMESDGALPLVTVPPADFNKENGVIWTSSPDCLELPPKPFHHSNSSGSPCVSDSGSDIFSKREVIHKLRQQLKQRDDMIMEMQDQIVELQSFLDSQVAHSTHLQSQLEAANRDLFLSEREIQRLRKAIADHCVGGTTDNKPRNGHANGFLDSESNFEVPEKGGRGDGERIEILKREVGELKEVIEGKEYLLQNYKEQTAELSLKIKELQQRLDSQLPNIL